MELFCASKCTRRCPESLFPWFFLASASLCCSWFGLSMNHRFWDDPPQNISMTFSLLPINHNGTPGSSSWSPNSPFLRELHLAWLVAGLWSLMTRFSEGVLVCQPLRATPNFTTNQSCLNQIQPAKPPQASPDNGSGLHWKPHGLGRVFFLTLC